MGDYFEVVVDLDATLDDMHNVADTVVRFLTDSGLILGERLIHGHVVYPPSTAVSEVVVNYTDDMHSMLFNYMEVIVGRQRHGTSEESPETIICPTCSESENDMNRWWPAVDAWVKTGEGLILCRRCGIRSPVRNWGHEPLWVYGNAGFKFWNWGRFKPDFVDKIRQLLRHEVVVISGML